MSERERKYLIEAFDSGWIAPAGPDLESFETAIASWTGAKHAVALSSGTAAIHLGLLVLGVQPGDEVFVSTLTFAATANGVVQAGAVPVFVDSESDSMNIDPDLLERELTERARTGRPMPKAVLAVDLYGQAANYERIEELCDRYGVILFEDAAEAVGASRHGKPCGSFGKAAIVSFNGNKISTSGGGGAFVSDDASLVDRVRYLSTQARQPVAHYEHIDIGFNYRLSNLLAAVGRGQLEWLAERIERRKEIRNFYLKTLCEVDGVEVTSIASGNTSNHWLTTIRLDPSVCGTNREDLRVQLEASNIESRAIWKPMHRQPIFQGHASLLTGVSDNLFESGLCLPSGSSMSDSDLARVGDALLNAFR